VKEPRVATVLAVVEVNAIVDTVAILGGFIWLYRKNRTTFSKKYTQIESPITVLMETYVLSNCY
jgi:hypothetical protein